VTGQVLRQGVKGVITNGDDTTRYADMGTGGIELNSQ
jgi:hypothetical protein